MSPRQSLSEPNFAKAKDELRTPKRGNTRDGAAKTLRSPNSVRPASQGPQSRGNVCGRGSAQQGRGERPSPAIATPGRRPRPRSSSSTVTTRSAAVVTCCPCRRLSNHPQWPCAGGGGIGRKPSTQDSSGFQQLPARKGSTRRAAPGPRETRCPTYKISCRNPKDRLATFPSPRARFGDVCGFDGVDAL